MMDLMQLFQEKYLGPLATLIAALIAAWAQIRSSKNSPSPPTAATPTTPSGNAAGNAQPAPRRSTESGRCDGQAPHLFTAANLTELAGEIEYHKSPGTRVTILEAKHER
jgi:hypothetical protein